MTELREELRQWLASGHTGTLVSVGAELQPHVNRIWAVRPGPALDELELFIFTSDASRLLDNMARHPTVAANIVEPPTYRSVLFKGPATVSDHGIQPEGIEALLAAVDLCFERVGLAPEAGAVMRGHYARADEFTRIVLRVVDIFDQTPRPGAGARLA